MSSFATHHHTCLWSFSYNSLLSLPPTVTECLKKNYRSCRHPFPQFPVPASFSPIFAFSIAQGQNSHVPFRWPFHEGTCGRGHETWPRDPHLMCVLCQLVESFRRRKTKQNQSPEVTTLITPAGCRPRPAVTIATLHCYFWVTTFATDLIHKVNKQIVFSETTFSRTTKDRREE